MHIYPNNWLLFKEENKKYFFKKEFEIKPDNESIFMNLQIECEKKIIYIFPNCSYNNSIAIFNKIFTNKSKNTFSKQYLF